MPKNVYETERLRLLLCREDYAPWVLGYYQRNRDFLRPYESARDESFFTLRHQRRYLAIEAQRAKQKTAARFFLCLHRPHEGEEIIGMVALVNIMMGPFCSAMLSYNLDEKHGGQGLMNEALRKMVEIAFCELGLHRLEANIMPRNTPSLNAVKRMGFANEGLARHYLEIDGQWEDHIHMVLINSGLPPGGF